MASSHDQHDGAATAGHEDPQTFEDAHADTDDHDAHGHDSHDDHGEEGSRWVLIPLGIGAAVAIAILLLVGVRSDAPERTKPIGATKADVAGEHGSTAEDEADEPGDEQSTPTTHE